MTRRRLSAAAAAALLALAGLALAAGARLDPTPVPEAAFTAYLKQKGAGAPRYSFPSAGPAVNLTWHEARAYCRAQGKRLPSAQEWLDACRAKRMRHPWWIWEWTTTDAGEGAHGAEAPFKLLCGPGAECACTHAYHPDWKNEVKGFRCAKPEPSVRLGRPR